MPLWNIYHTPDTFTDELKAEFADRLTNLTYPHFPAFYVGVVFIELDPKNFYIGGKPAKKFVRIWIDHINRKLPTSEDRGDWVQRALKSIEPMFTEQGFNWELHVDETGRDLWLIQGLVPPQYGTKHADEWRAQGHPSPYAMEETTSA
jgi:phenylpyruvate tautomerase PptA (4-oxalocrotonate tautomerase family)